MNSKRFRTGRDMGTAFRRALVVVCLLAWSIGSFAHAFQHSAVAAPASPVIVMVSAADDGGASPSDRVADVCAICALAPIPFETASIPAPAVMSSRVIASLWLLPPAHPPGADLRPPIV